MPDEATPRFTRKGRATQARIVDVAAKLMFQRGIAGTSIDEVRNTAAVSGSQISHYFHDKRDLTRQGISARRDDVRQFHSQPELGALDSLEALQAWADANVADINAVYRKGGCVYGSLAGELVEADAEIHGDLATGYDQWIGLFHAGLIEMRRRGFDVDLDVDRRLLRARRQRAGRVRVLERQILHILREDGDLRHRHLWLGAAICRRHPDLRHTQILRALANTG